MLNATAEQLARLLSAAQSLHRHAQEWADVLIDEDADAQTPLYAASVEEIETDIAAFCAIRLEIEGVQQALDMHPRPQEAP